MSSTLFNLFFYSLLTTPTQCVGWVNVAGRPGSKVKNSSKMNILKKKNLLSCLQQHLLSQIKGNSINDFF
jgi:hypothetical protein